MTDHGLSNQQLAVICALSSGASMFAAAQEAGVHRNTIANWRRNSLPFQHALVHAQYDWSLYFREKSEDLADLASQSVKEILTDSRTPPSVRPKAALAIIITTATTTPPAPKKQVEFDIVKIVAQQSTPETVTEGQLASDPPAPNNAQPTLPQALDSPSPQPPPVHKNAQAGRAGPRPEDPQAAHKDAQPTPEMCADLRPFAAKALPNTAQALKVGRNGTCPCGSGKKYKKFCLNKPAIGVRRESVQRLASAV